MPEGDTIYRTAARLAQAIEGRELLQINLPRWAGTTPLVGELVTSVAPVGKHLFIEFSGGRVLETHMKMTGSWHLYRSGERWQRARHRMRALLVVDGWEAVCFDAPVVRLATRSQLRRELEHLGPDLTPGATDEQLVECVDRMGRLVDPATPLAEVLLDQRICCGVGNVYKSEVCWALEIDPGTPLGALDPATRFAMVRTSSDLLAANLDHAARVTVRGGLAVYGRAGQPCRRCGQQIQVAHTGPHARVTFWCPGCQQVPRGG